MNHILKFSNTTGKLQLRPKEKFHIRDSKEEKGGSVKNGDFQSITGVTREKSGVKKLENWGDVIYG